MILREKREWETGIPGYRNIEKTRYLNTLSMFPVLIVDDSREDLMLADRVLRQCKILNPIHLLSSGEACIDFLRRNFVADDESKAPQPCLIFLDLGMHPMSGIETLRAINEMPVASKSCVVMLSGITDIKMIREGYQLGARTFLVKPLKAEDVMDFLQSVETLIR